MQALLDKSTIYTEALKEQMDRSREKLVSVAQTRTPKAKQKQRAGRSGRHASGGRKRVRLGSDDEETGMSLRNAPGLSQAKQNPLSNNLRCSPEPN